MRLVFSHGVFQEKLGENNMNFHTTLSDEILTIADKAEEKITSPLRFFW